MKKIFVSLLVFSFALLYNHVFSQPVTKPPDYKKIQEAIFNTASNYYYPKLFERYVKNDTTLSEEDYWYLYFGYTYHKDYKPFGFSKLIDTIQKYIAIEKPTIKELDLIIRYAKMIEEEYPFSLRVQNYLGYAYSKKGDKSSASKISFKTNKLLVTMLRSGDGKTKETAWHIISIDNEYDIMMALNVQYGGKQELVDNIYDHIKLAPNRYNVPEIYFNVGRMLFVSEINKQRQENQNKTEGTE